jgi:hypothetical protein
MELAYNSTNETDPSSIKFRRSLPRLRLKAMARQAVK